MISIVSMGEWAKNHTVDQKRYQKEYKNSSHMTKTKQTNKEKPPS